MTPHRAGPPQRIVVVGTTGSGKTTLARDLAERLSLPHVELDALNWDPNWTEAPAELFRERVEAAIQGPGWVVDGNYAKARDLVWSRAELLVWLDYTLPLVLWRLVRRTLQRWAKSEELWNGNREQLREHLFTRNSLWLWALQTHRRRRRSFPAQIALPEYRQLTVVRLRSPRATQEWLKTVTAAAVTPGKELA